jgi:hypothetical protein
MKRKQFNNDDGKINQCYMYQARRRDYSVTGRAGKTQRRINPCITHTQNVKLHTVNFRQVRKYRA